MESMSSWLSLRTLKCSPFEKALEQNLQCMLRAVLSLRPRLWERDRWYVEGRRRKEVGAKVIPDPAPLSKDTYVPRGDINA